MITKRRTAGLLSFLLVFAFVLAPMRALVTFAADGDVSLKDLSVKDPFIFVDKYSQTYFMYAVNPDAENPGVIAYQSKDLATWSAPAVVYNVPGEAWNAKEEVMTPEVSLYNGKYYLFVTLQNTAEDNTRGANDAIVNLNRDPGNDGHYMRNYLKSIIVAVSDTPIGPFVDIDKTSPVIGDLKLMHRDGSLYIDPDGTPYLIYAHDWIQKIDGNFQAVELKKDDLSKKASDQFLLFRASLAAFYFDPAYEGSPDYKQANSDEFGTYKAFNPQVYDMPDGSLAMLWGTEREGKMVVSQAVSKTGSLKGPWDQTALLLRDDRSAAMSFTALDGSAMLLCQGPDDKAELYGTIFTGDGFRLVSHRGDLDGLDVSAADTLAPRIFPPSTRLAETEADSAEVIFNAMAYDNIDGWIDVTYSTPSGSVFAKGTHSVTVTATDAAGNISTASFKVIVGDPKPKEIPPAYETKITPTDPEDPYPRKLPSMGIHDPYIYYDPVTDHYIFHQGTGRNVWKSKDLENWMGPVTAYTIVSNNLNMTNEDGVTNGYVNYQSWKNYEFSETTPWNLNSGNWAAEMHYYKGKYYFFTTLHNSRAVPFTSATGEDSARWRGNQWRATIIAVGDSPEGPFKNMHYTAPVTPREFMTLDGTFYVDHDGTPWLVYAHEWIQKLDGPMEAIPLTADLTGAAGEPLQMFRASFGSDWSEYQTYQYQPQFESTFGRKYYTWDMTKELSHKQHTNVVTDGPHIWETPDGSLVCLFTTYRDDEYIQSQLISPTGNIAGPWLPAPALDYDDKGHGMVFENRDGELMLVMHNNMGGTSNGATSRQARAEICDVKLTNDGFRITKHRSDLDGQTGATSYEDVLAPLIYAPASRYAKAASEAGAEVSFTAFAMDDRDGWNYKNPDEVKLTYSHQPGSTFPVGETVVTITAEDTKGNISTETFSVYVIGEKPDEGSIVSVSYSGFTQLVFGCAANIPVTVETENADGRKVVVSLVVSQIPAVVSDPVATAEVVDGKAILRVPAINGLTVFLVAQFEGDNSSQKTVKIPVVQQPTNLWAPEFNQGAPEGKTQVVFADEISLKAGAVVTINGITATASSSGNVLTIDKEAASGQLVVMKGVKYPNLFPSYSFTFTLAVS